MTSWFLVYTRFQQERRAIDQLRSLGFDCVAIGLPGSGDDPQREGNPWLLARLLLVRVDGYDRPSLIEALRGLREISGIVQRGAAPVIVDDDFIEALGSATARRETYTERGTSDRRSTDLTGVSPDEQTESRTSSPTHRTTLLELVSRCLSTSARLRLRKG